jgi:hypothetical protein
MTTPDLGPKEYRSELEPSGGLPLASASHGQKQRNHAKSVTTVREGLDAARLWPRITPSGRVYFREFSRTQSLLLKGEGYRRRANKGKAGEIRPGTAV